MTASASEVIDDEMIHLYIRIFRSQFLGYFQEKSIAFRKHVVLARDRQFMAARAGQLKGETNDPFRPFPGYGLNGIAPLT